MGLVPFNRLSKACVKFRFALPAPLAQNFGTIHRIAATMSGTALDASDQKLRLFQLFSYPL